MNFTLAQKKGTFVLRENRFVGVVKLEEGDSEEVVRAHVPNTGRCKELLLEGTEVILEDRENGSRKYRYELILVKKNGNWVSIDSQLPNKLAKEAIECGTIRILDDPFAIKTEHTEGNSRFDLLLTSENGQKCFVEVKGVTLEKDGMAMFPDAPTERGRKHLEELIRLRKEGHRAVVLFIIQMEKIHGFRPYHENDPGFAEKLREAKENGVQVLAYRCKVDREKIQVVEEVRWDNRTEDV